MIRAFGRPYPGGGGLTHLFPDASTLAKANLLKIGFSERHADRIRALARGGSHWPPTEQFITPITLAVIWDILIRPRERC